MAPSVKTPSAGELHGSRDRFWIPRFWSGITTWPWLALLARNRFAVTPRRWVMALIITLVSLLNTVLWLLQMLLYSRRIRRTEIVPEPIFVIGHWRSGTTLLHELLVLDPRHTYPDTYASFGPNHFLVSGWLFRPLLRFLLPRRRPMDNMPAGWDRPQEDEFALCNMGARSPYLTFAFPNRPPQDQEYLTLEGVSPRALARWKRKFLWFLKCLTVRNPRRIVLKSPPHTCRLRVLLEMFPRAKFVHIVRDPFVLFPSTINLLRRMYRDQGCQYPHYRGLEEHVFRTFTQMYEVFERDRYLIPTTQFCELRYEDLVANPVEQMQRVYEQLGLGEFERVRPAIAAYFAASADYKTNRYTLSEEQRAEIARRWRDYLVRYGYADPSEPAHAETVGGGRLSRAAPGMIG
jgi:hypothetical protein